MVLPSSSPCGGPPPAPPASHDDWSRNARRRVEQPVGQHQRRHQHVFGNRLLVADDIADRDVARQRRQIDQIDPGSRRLQQLKTRRLGKILFPDMADNDLRLGQRRDQTLAVADIKKHAWIERLGDLIKDQGRYPPTEIAEKKGFHR
jgi:hypothetical protein